MTSAAVALAFAMPGGGGPTEPPAGYLRLGLHQRYSHAPGLVEADIDGGRVLLSTRTGRMYTLNETACRTWMALRVVSAGSAAMMLAAEFDVPSAQARSDVMALVETLCDAGLLFPAG